jgi:hypothetical protein
MSTKSTATYALIALKYSRVSQHIQFTYSLEVMIVEESLLNLLKNSSPSSKTSIKTSLYGTVVAPEKPIGILRQMADLFKGNQCQCKPMI